MRQKKSYMHIISLKVGLKQDMNNNTINVTKKIFQRIATARNVNLR